MKAVRFHPETLTELDEAAGYYETQKPGLGADLRAAVEDAVRKVAANPERWPPLTARTRRYRLRRFPYMLIYLILPDRISALALTHEKHRPGYWKHRR